MYLFYSLLKELFGDVIETVIFGHYWLLIQFHRSPARGTTHPL